nr:GNAT family N-acetyltransferase [Oceanivirga salmonicida]
MGICDLFMHNKIAKIENFLVIPKYQRKGYGTYILKNIIDIALENGTELIYLITNENDTAKEMYEKLYFDKVGERIEIVFDLKNKKI